MYGYMFYFNTVLKTIKEAEQKYAKPEEGEFAAKIKLVSSQLAPD